eukprot:TRINITY_DN60358_c1_g1_i1.p1 TRINITY_DN60358_c1_g1~~TRINITY_DN60358_c1_g1_i1.p1  ORF type:complete len:107 (-),score=5.62 TRINITY_DN60358_c1_g1_i1:60-347(-)
MISTSSPKTFSKTFGPTSSLTATFTGSKLSVEFTSEHGNYRNADVKLADFEMGPWPPRPAKNLEEIWNHLPETMMIHSGSLAGIGGLWLLRMDKL